MKNQLLKLARALIPAVLCIALISTVFVSISSIENLNGNARIINYIGIVRGATQRLIKKELNNEPDDKLVEQLDNILSGLVNGSTEYNLVKLQCDEFQGLLLEMKQDWTDIKEEIYRYRAGSPKETLYEMSENYFVLADKAVFAAESYTEETVQKARSTLRIMNITFFFMIIAYVVIYFYQEKRRKQLIAAENENKRKSEHLTRCMQELLAPLNEISEMMYVADMDTYELLFVNEAGKRIFNIDDDLKGLKCYEVVQNFDAPCSFCTNPVLEVDKTHSWEYTNPVLKKHYLLKDRLIQWDGRIARMEIAFDITESNNEKIELKKRLERDNIRLECVRELYHNHDVNAAITNVLKQIGNLFSAERTYVLILKNDRFSNIAEWCKEGIIPQIDNLQDVPLVDYQEWIKLLERHECVIIDDIEDIKTVSPSGYSLLKRQSIKNLIWIPLERDGELRGCIGLDNHEQNMSHVAIPFLQTVQYFIALAMQRNEDEKNLFELSHLDKLTSFYNRNCFIQDTASIKNKHNSIGVVYLDVNGLKETNDRFGHDAGDRLLKTCAEIMKNSSVSDALYRIGGDEFVIIYENISEDAFNDEVRKLKNNFRNSECQAAVGSKWDENCSNITNIIKTADELMYEDKKKFYQKHPVTNRYRHNNELLRFLQNPDVLMDKMANSNFKVYMQAKIDVEKDLAVGSEALIRYEDEDGVIYTPDKFISLLEESNFISKLDYYVFEEVCRILHRWEMQGKKVLPVSCNFSRNTFMDVKFVKKITDISNKHKITKELLEIEIIENNDSADLDTLITRIHEIKKAGFKVALDDFGIECSNLVLLSKAEFDVLKIDRSLISDIVANPKARILVETTVNVCGILGMKLVAEGVETEEQLDILKKCNVKTVQGFLFSRPIPAEDYEKKYAV
ncbi:MAG: EAL domain-containing protein [Eubacteriales bacterium]|nr:EAL domain-containing protein [Eubacteriales bacterium]